MNLRLLVSIFVFLVARAVAQPPDLFKEIGEILVELSKITGWKAPNKIDSDTITKQGLKHFLEARLKEVVKP
ncbi:MAG TPA: hypothetical protein VM120_14315, partial [Bryobacteraceae bacterium]|nr:hypothetical protein [Bryobacteraceae bacterium]